MSFRRTNNGLSNLALFLRADVVAFVEGGPHTLSLSDLASGHGHTKTNDTAFWQVLFDCYRPTKRVRIRSVGSKTKLREIANLIAAGQIFNVYVAMDRDYDNHLGRQVIAPGILYTKGYSFENDTWTPNVVRELFWGFCPQERDNPDASSHINLAFEQFHKDIARAIRANVALAANGQKLILGEPALELIEREKKRMPRFNIQQFRNKLKSRSKERKCFCPPSVNKLSPQDDCHGKVVAAVGHQILLYVLSLYRTRAVLSWQLAAGQAITTFERCLRNGELVGHSAHYAKQFAHLPS